MGEAQTAPWSHRTPDARTGSGVLDRRDDSARPQRRGVATIERDSMRVVVRAKQHDACHVKLFTRLPSGQWHCIGAVHVARLMWDRCVKPMLMAGARAIGADLTIDDPQPQRGR